MIRSAFTAAAFLLVTTVAQAQVCDPGHTLLKNDNLPDDPGSQPVSVIPGLCEGEACGAVFDVSQVSSQVTLRKAGVGYVNAGGANGVTALVNLKVYDGITWSGGIPVLGPEVLDWVNDTGSSIQIASSGINFLDLNTFAPTITSGTMVVTWFMDFNTSSGSCATGYQTNFATDNSQPACGGSCSPQQKNLIFIQGQGWRDAATATVTGIPICPCYYAGNWLIRACVEPTGLPATYCTAKQNSQNCFAGSDWAGSPTVAGSDDFFVTCNDVVNQKNGIMFWGTGSNTAPFFGGTLCVAQPVKRTSLQNSGGNSGPPFDCTGTYSFHFSHAYMASQGLAAGAHLYAQHWYRDPQVIDGTNVGLSDGLEWILLP